MTSNPPLPSTFVDGFHDPAVVAKMPYRLLGSRLVSTLSFGGTALGGIYTSTSGEPAAMLEATELVHHAVKSGINLIDVAPWYGHGRAESVLGEALVGVPRSAYYLTTKVARYNATILEMFDFTYERTLRSIDESLARLRVDYLDTVQVHDPEFAPSLDVVVSETLPALAAAMRAGKIRAIGITGYPLDILQTLHAAATAAGIPVESCLSYSHYCLHDTALVDSGTLAYMTAHKVGVLNGSPLSMSLLTHAGAPDWHPAVPALRARAKAAAAYCEAAGVSIERLGMAFALANPDIPTTLFSTSRMVKLIANLAQATGDSPLSAVEEKVLLQVKEQFFSGEGYDAIKSWEGVEVTKVHAKIGKQLLVEWYAEAAKKRQA
jgi:L-galactose dehydrogenase